MPTNQGDPEKPESSQPEPLNTQDHSNPEPEKEDEGKDKDTVTRTEFTSLSSDVVSLHEAVSELTKTAKNVVSAAPESGTEATTGAREESATPITPPVIVEDKKEIYAVRKRGGRVVRRERVKA